MSYNPLEGLERLILKSIALLGLNIVAFIYDGQYIALALGVDALMLGVELNGHWSKDKTK